MHSLIFVETRFQRAGNYIYLWNRCCSKLLTVSWYCTHSRELVYPDMHVRYYCSGLLSCYCSPFIAPVIQINLGHELTMQRMETLDSFVAELFRACMSKVLSLHQLRVIKLT